jgi:hypothetical protein
MSKPSCQGEICQTIIESESEDYKTVEYMQVDCSKKLRRDYDDQRAYYKGQETITPKNDTWRILRPDSDLGKAIYKWCKKKKK